MFELIRQDRPSVVPGDRTRDGRAAQEQADIRLLTLGDEPRAHAGNRRGERLAPELPAIGGTPPAVVDVPAPERAPDVAAGNLFAAIQKRLLDVAYGELRVNVDALFGNRLEGAFTFDEPREPRPICFVCHASILAQKLNPEYAAMAERRIKGDASLFAEVVAA